MHCDIICDPIWDTSEVAEYSFVVQKDLPAEVTSESGPGASIKFYEQFNMLLLIFAFHSGLSRLAFGKHSLIFKLSFILIKSPRQCLYKH